VKNKFEYLRAKKVLIKDSLHAFYIYETRQEVGNLFCGITAGASIKDYNTNVIKKHEATITKREINFKIYLKAVQFNAAPVLLTYSDDPVIEKGIETAKKNAEEINAWNDEDQTHKIWCINNLNDIITLKKMFANVPSLYIADNHHRSVSSALLANEMDINLSAKNDNAYNYFLSYLIPEKQLNIYDYNRLIKNLNGITPKAFIDEIKLLFNVEDKGVDPYSSSLKN
tara:strand:- start:68 stop:748 length:681 start_codon:yes stop_codon:yes gene_type:complete